MYRLLAAAAVASVTIALTGEDTSVMNNFFSRLAFGKNKVLGGWQLKFDTYAFAAPPAAAGRFGNAGHGDPVPDSGNGTMIVVNANAGTITATHNFPVAGSPRTG